MTKGRAKNLSAIQTVSFLACLGFLVGCSPTATSSGVPAVIGNVSDARVTIGLLADSATLERVRATAAIALDDARRDGFALDVAWLPGGGDGSPAAAYDAAIALSRRGDVVAVIAALSPIALDRVVAVLRDADRPMIVNAAIESGTGWDRVVNVVPSHRATGVAAAKLVVDHLRSHTPGAITGIASVDEAVIEGFRMQVSRTRAPVFESYPFAVGGGDPLVALATKHVDSVFVGEPPSKIAQALRFAPLKGLRVPFVLSRDWLAPARDLANSAGLTCYVIVPVAFDIDATSRALGDRLNVDPIAPDLVVAMTYDASRAVFAAIRAADSAIDPVAVGRALRVVADVPGVTGRFSIVNGEAVRSMVARRISPREDVVETRIDP
jgi:ABC-type branched-subunit amino acid transport system substrate-binding protein